MKKVYFWNENKNLWQGEPLAADNLFMSDEANFYLTSFGNKQYLR